MRWKWNFRILMILAAAMALEGNCAEAVDVYRPDAGSLEGELRDREMDNPELVSGKAEIAPEEKERPQLALPEDMKIKVNGFKISGQDIYDDSTLQALVAEYQGRLVSFKELQAGADKITAYFRKKGYLMARCYIPQQKISGGIVEYMVMVGRLDSVVFDNKTTIHEAVLKREVAFLQPGAYLTRKKLERAVWLLSDLAGAEAKAMMVPGGKTGTVTLKIEMTPHQGKCGLLSGDNYGNRYTGYNGYGLFYNVLNPAHEGDQLSLAGSTTGSQFYNYSINYILPAAKDGLRWSLGYNRLSYELGDKYANLDACGTAYLAHMGLDYAIERSQHHNLYAGLRYEHNYMKDEIRFGAASNIPKHSDGMVLSLYGDDLQRRGAFTWRVDYKWGHLTFENEEGRQQGRWAGTAGSFHKVHFHLMQQQWLNRRLQLFLSARGQAASSNLDSSEHFALGGASGVRAYPASEASGDIGYLLRAELRYVLPFPGKNLCQLAAFFDHGGVQINKHDDGTGDNRRYLQGAGLGLLYSRRNEFFIRADYAWAIGAEEPKSDRQHTRSRFWLRGGIYF